MRITLRDRTVVEVSTDEASDIIRQADYVRWYDALPGGPVDRVDVGDLALPAFLDGVPNFKRLLADFTWARLEASLAVASAALRRVPAHVSLNEWEDSEPHREALRRLFIACTGGQNDSLPGFGPAICTKMLHKKRPSLIPIIDSWQLEAWGKKPDPWSTSDMVDVVFDIRDFMADQVQEFSALAEQLVVDDVSLPALSSIRLYDILFWEMSR